MSPNENEEDFDYCVKIVLIGDSGVGKTNILTQFCKHEFNMNSLSTVGVEFASNVLTVFEKKVKLQIWDTAGQERFKAITNIYYCRAKGALVVFDLTSASSFQNVDGWIASLTQMAEKDVTIILVGNKSDLNKSRKITKEQGIEKAKSLGLFGYMDTSALNNTNIYDTFNMLAENIYQKSLSKIEENIEQELHLKDSIILGLSEPEEQGQENVKKKGRKRDYCCK